MSKFAFVDDNGCGNMTDENNRTPTDANQLNIIEVDRDAMMDIDTVTNFEQYTSEWDAAKGQTEKDVIIQEPIVMQKISAAARNN